MAAKRSAPKVSAQDYIPQLMTRLLAAVNNSGGRDLASLGLSTQAARTLVTLMDHGPMRVSRLADLVGLEPTGLSHLMRALGQRGLIDRERDDGDHRAVIAALTPQGRTLARRCADLHARHESALLRDLPHDEANRLRDVLRRMISNMGGSAQAAE